MREANNTVLQSARNVNEWFDYFGTLSRHDFYATVGAVLTSGAKDVDRSLLLAIARKTHDDANFSEGLSIGEREKWEAFAEEVIFYAMASSDEKDRAAIEAGWSYTKDAGLRFGYKSGAIFETLRPHRVFSG
ncbi:hypothetical protein M2322_002773 [Rhodoblastus acidophilus]|uniref:hypothetical protein n=1 Tax=Rhodoblastus acidophilus TaxID=1074 RepID=UPI0022240E00|nr:hypothetical protein [Rhodoblastus acidophilus]MCW2317219.1 hypothetical protein [Rhodoblastus acidophilus]